MNAVRIRALVSLLLMVAAFAGAAAWKPTRHLADLWPKVELETMFPKQIGEWVIDERMPVQLISPDQEAVLNAIYNQTLSRTYINRSGQRIMLSVAYGGDQSDATRAHRPEVCYPAQGFTMLSSRNATVTTPELTVPVRQLVAKLGGRVEPITYWITVGESIAVSGTGQKLAQLGYSTRGIIPDGMLVRISSIDTDAERAYVQHQAFIAAMSQALGADTRSRVMGGPGGPGHVALRGPEAAR